MQTAKKIQVRTARLAFEALSIEGGLLSPEWLAKMAQLKAEHQAESDYGISKGLTLRDEIGRYWRVAQAHWKEFAAGREKNANPKALADNFVKGLLKESFCFSSLRATEPAVIAERSYPTGTAALEGRVPVVIAPAASGLDTLSPSFGDGTRRRSAFGLAQEYLNAEDKALWGVASDGVTLRILRDNASMTRPTWLEADLERIFKEERYADFAALWLLVHETRFGRTDQLPSECALERWRESGRQEGTRARDKLRYGFEEALVALGQGFLSHPENQALRISLQNGTLTKEDFYRQLLRLVYRLIFVLTIEERGLLHPEDTDGKIEKLYEDGYSLRRLRERAVKRSAHDRFSDLWEATKIVFRGLARGEPRLGLPALSGLFSLKRCPDIDLAKLENRSLLLGMFRLSWLREQAGLSRVNWRDMGPEELGSVYESLLELVPQIAQDGRSFKFASGGETKGNARKTSGSYYTPDNLVQVLLDSALEPVIADTIKANPDKPVDALLSLSIVDPACGSGHFLLGAARRLAVHVARLQANGTPSAGEYRHALRQVISKCLYGVDINPMAVELCQVSLWLEAMEVGPPMTFLDSHIQCGNSLLGTTPELMAKGIPDAAWEPIEGDDKKIASGLKKRNKKSVAGQLGLVLSPGGNEVQAVARGVSELEAMPDMSIQGLDQKEEKWGNLQGSTTYQHPKFVADAWCAAFVWPKQLGPLADAAPVNEIWQRFRDGAKASLLTEKIVTELAQQYQFFHWHLAFSRIFAKGGFDIVLGNPPWERVKLQEQEFFASRSDEIENASNAAERKRFIGELSTTNPNLWHAWQAALRVSDGQSKLVRETGKYPLCGRGDVNTYAIFSELNRNLLRPVGRAGFIIPAGIATDDTTKEFFSSLVVSGNLHSLYHFENEDRIFPSVHHAYRFCLLTLKNTRDQNSSDFVFFARNINDLNESHRHFSLTSSEFLLLNPNTKTCPTFRWQRDAEISKAIYRRVPVLQNDNIQNGDPWTVRFMAMIHMANDSNLFRTKHQLEFDGWQLENNIFEKNKEYYLPLFEAKMFHHFDHRFGTYESQTQSQSNQGKLPEVTHQLHENPNFTVLPEYWISEKNVEQYLSDKWIHSWLLAWRNITGTEKSRTVIASILPRSAVGHSAPIFIPRNLTGPAAISLSANLSSFILDYCARQKVGGINLTYSYLKQFPVLLLETYDKTCVWSSKESLQAWLLPRVIELTYTAWDLEAFAKDCGYNNPPYKWNAERRFWIRAELDAAFFRLYGVSRDDADYIMETFPIVRKNDEKAHGKYLTKEAILKIYDEMSEAERTGKPYETRLSPPPADPRVAHPARAEERKPAPIIQFPKPKPATPRIPVWAPGVIEIVAKASQDLSSDESWSMPLSGEHLGIAVLAAILRQLPNPLSRREIEVVAGLTLLPAHLLDHLSKADAAQLKRLIGTTELQRKSLADLKIPWSVVIRDAVRQRILDLTSEGLWGPGEGAGNPPKPELDARAKVALSCVLSGAHGIDVSQYQGMLNVK